MVVIIMERCGWKQEIHTILGKKQKRWHKNGFEIPNKEVRKIIEEWEKLTRVLKRN